MSFSSRRKRSFNSPPANRLRVASQQPRPVCTWSAHALQSGPSPSPFPRNRHTLTATATAAGELFIFGGYVRGRASSDLHVFSTRDLSTTILQTSGDIPGTRVGHGAALIGTSTLLICGGETNLYDQNVLNHDSLYLLNFGTSDLLISSPSPADHSVALQYRKSGSTLYSMVLDQMVVPTTPQTWSVPSSSSSVVRSAGMFLMICGHSI
jgi:hypothetical protein